MSDNKIRMIVSDVDGTLAIKITDKMPLGLFDCVRKITDDGGFFGVATGRPYTNVRDLFEDVSDRIYMFVENGCLVFKDGELIDRTIMDTGHELEIIEDLRKYENCGVMISGVYKAVSFRDNMDFIYLVRDQVGFAIDLIDDISEFDEPFMKISMLVMDVEKVPEWILSELHEKYDEYFQIFPSGHGWIDIIPKDAGKGTAIARLMKKLGVDNSELMVFGDHENDVSMFELTDHSYCMSHSMPHVQKKAKHITDSPVREMKRELGI